MARINSLLSIVVDQGANELRVGSGREAQMFAFGKPKRLHLPAVTDEMLRDLLGEILAPEVAASLQAQGRSDVAYDGGALGPFKVSLTGRSDGGIDAVFLRGGAARRESSVSPGATPPAAPLPPAVGKPVAAATSPSLQAWIEVAASMNASDVHLSDGAPPVLRVEGGGLRQVEGAEPVDVASLLGKDDYDRLLRDKSVDLSFEVPGVRRARVHAYVTSDGLAAAIRILPLKAPTFASLQMPVAFDDVIGLPHGLVLVCGAAGAGKSTTLASLAQAALQKRSIVLVTLEDPIEFGLDAGETSVVRRRQVGRDAASFASGLRDALREDPDVLLVGEMRDPETISLAITAAETGHLVLASIHSRGAVSAIERVIDSYPAAHQQQIRVQLADSLSAVIAQRLVRKARGSGRLPVIEVLRGNHAVSTLIREGKTAQIPSAIQSSRREGMLSLERCLADRVQAGEIRIEDARAAADDPNTLELYLGRPGAI